MMINHMHKQYSHHKKSRPIIKLTKLIEQMKEF